MVETEVGELGQGHRGIRHALLAFRHYASRLEDQVEAAWGSAPTEDLRIDAMRGWNDHLRERIVFFDESFRRGHRGLPSALASNLERDVASMGLPPHEAVITLGTPTNFGTFVPNLVTALFDSFDIDRQIPPELQKLDLIFVSVPEIEGSRAAWQPIIAGHELGHLLQALRPISLGSPLKLDKPLLSKTTDPLPASTPTGFSRARAIEQIAARWLKELICDAYAVHQYGAAGVAALSDFLSFVSPVSFAGDTHPPRALRTRLMLKWLGTTADSAQVEIASMVEGLDSDDGLYDWAQLLCKAFESVAEQVWLAVGVWRGTQAYQDRGRQQIVEQLSDLIASGIPGAERIDVEGSVLDVESADVINASWLCFARRKGSSVNRLALKALDTLDFLIKWQAAGGGASETAHSHVYETGPGALSARDLEYRLGATDKSRLTVTPLLPNAIGSASVDLRIGNRFIVFQRANSSGFDALDTNLDPRSIQTSIEKSWGDTFYLHPGQLVLAATLEYIVMPNDLTAQVITRSSYGRLGLLSATAVQVHPNFAGCLTLELVNLGDMPMALTPGERVAQLLLFTMSSPVEDQLEVKYTYPTGPEFSKIRHDEESEVLRRLRKEFGE